MTAIPTSATGGFNQLHRSSIQPNRTQHGARSRSPPRRDYDDLANFEILRTRVFYSVGCYCFCCNAHVHACVRYARTITRVCYNSRFLLRSASHPSSFSFLCSLLFALLLFLFPCLCCFVCFAFCLLVCFVVFLLFAFAFFVSSLFFFLRIGGGGVSC